MRRRGRGSARDEVHQALPVMRGVEPGREERTRHKERERETEGEAREQKRKRSRAEQS